MLCAPERATVSGWAEGGQEGRWEQLLERPHPGRMSRSSRVDENGDCGVVEVRADCLRGGRECGRRLVERVSLRICTRMMVSGGGGLTGLNDQD